MALVKKFKSGELIDRINGLIEEDKIPDEFTLCALKRDAKALISQDPAHGYMILGMIAAIEGDKDELKRHHEKSLFYGVNPYIGNLNFMTSLRNAGCHSAALEYARLAFRAEADLEIVENLIRLNVHCLRFQEAIKYVEQLGMLRKDMEDHPLSPLLKKASSLLSKNALRDDDLAKIAQLAEELISEKGVRSRQVVTAMCSEGGVEWIAVEDFVACTPYAAAELNLELAERLVDADVDSAALELVSYRFISKPN